MFGRRGRASDDGERWLVAGLGNPDDRYGGTRHNVGAEVAAVLAARLGQDLTVNKRVRAAVAEGRDGDARLVVVRPTSYMNESGGPVQAAVAWFKVPVERLIVVHDDLDLELGELRLKRGGGNGGHNGLRDIDQRLGTRDYLRVRVGIGRPPGRQPARDYVLQPFTAKEREEVAVTVEEAADAALLLVHEGLEAAQNRYHGRARERG